VVHITGALGAGIRRKHFKEGTVNLPRRLKDWVKARHTAPTAIRLIDRRTRLSMRRRDFMAGIVGSAAAWPMAGHAQQPGQMRRIGFLRAAPPPQRELNAFLRALADRGYVEGQNFF
jgi:hypothetical protein